MKLIYYFPGCFLLSVQIYGLRTSAQLLVISCSMLDAVSNPLSIFPLLDERAKNWVLSLKEKRGTYVSVFIHCVVVYLY